MKMSPGVLAPPHEILTPQEWQARGRARRDQVPRADHARWEPPPDRPDPVAILEEQAKTRVPDLVPIRYGRMLTSPFAYFRGAAAPMAWDLAHTPTTGIRVQACGDAHLLNFGMFAAPDRRLVFDVNDFDETLPAPFEWDVKRLAASFAVAARDNGFSDTEARAAARFCARSYRTEMARYATMRFLNVWYSRIDVDQVTRLFDGMQSQGGGAAPPPGHQEGAAPHQPEGAEQVLRPGRGRTPDPPGQAGDRPVPDRAEPRDARRVAQRDRAVPGDAAGRPARGAAPVLLRRLRAQGRGRRLGRHRVLRPAADGRPRRRAAVPPAQGGAGVGSRAVRRAERVRPRGRAGGPGAADDPGRRRRVPRLDHGHRDRRRDAAGTTTCASYGT